MILVLQRVTSASVSAPGQPTQSIGLGFLLLVGFTHTDTEVELRHMAAKISTLRLFADGDQKMNLDLSAVGGSLLVVPQFTLYAEVAGQRRPSFTRAAPRDQAKQLFDRFVELLKQGLPAAEPGSCRVLAGYFGAHMSVKLDNDGPVTLVLDSDRL